MASNSNIIEISTLNINLILSDLVNLSLAGTIMAYDVSAAKGF
jgi:hypothetical protein